MNIFMTNECPIQSAYDHCSVHVVKMILELSQLLSTAHRLLDGDEKADQMGLYKATHRNHPSSIFVRSSSANYGWAALHLEALHEHYERISGKVHASKRILNYLVKPPVGLPTGSFEPVIAAPDSFKQLATKRGVMVAYRAYMNHKFAEWQQRERPIKVKWPLGQPDWVELSRSEV